MHMLQGYSATCDDLDNIKTIALTEVVWRAVYEHHRTVGISALKARLGMVWVKRINLEQSVQHAASMSAESAKSHHMAGCRDLLLTPARPCTHCTWVQTFFQSSLTADIRSQDDPSRDTYTEPRRRTILMRSCNFFCYCDVGNARCYEVVMTVRVRGASEDKRIL